MPKQKNMEKTKLDQTAAGVILSLWLKWHAGFPSYGEMQSYKSESAAIPGLRAHSAQ